MSNSPPNLTPRGKTASVSIVGKEKSAWALSLNSATTASKCYASRLSSHWCLSVSKIPSDNSVIVLWYYRVIQALLEKISDQLRVFIEKAVTSAVNEEMKKLFGEMTKINRWIEKWLCPALCINDLEQYQQHSNIRICDISGSKDRTLLSWAWICPQKGWRKMWSWCQSDSH